MTEGPIYKKVSLLPEVVKNLLIINVLLYLLKTTMINFGYDLDDILGLHYFKSDKFKVHQIVTHMFMHGDFGHLFFNMFALWMFGSVIENYWGPKKFLIFYVFTGFGAAILHYTIVNFEVQSAISLMDGFINNPNAETLADLTQHHKFLISDNQYPEIASKYREFRLSLSTATDAEAIINAKNFVTYYRSEYFNILPVIVGASGALFGILLAFGMIFPNSPIFIFFIPIPIKAKYMVIGYGLIELFSGIQNNDNIAHFAHLGGMLFGFILIKFWQKQKYT